MRLALLLGLLAVAPAASAAKKTEKLAVLPIILAGPHGAATLSSVVADVGAAAELRIGLRMLSVEEMFVSGADELGARVRNCGSDTACIANRLRAFDARLGLVVLANLMISPPLVSVQLLDTDEQRMVGQSIGELEGGETLSAAIRRRAEAVFDGGGYQRAGRISVAVTPPNARLSLGEGIDADAGRGTVFTVPPGRYEVSATADGHAGASAVAVVASGQSVEVRLVLERETSVLGAWWFWTAIGVAVAGGATAAIVATRPTTRCLCTTINGVGCEVCQ